MKYYLYIIMLLFGMSSCSKELSPAEQFQEDTRLIDEYLKANNKTAQKTAEGIYYIVEKEGSAEKPKLTSTVSVGYKGYFLDNTVFDSNAKTSFKLFNVIEGWQIGIPKFGKGGKGTLLIPSIYGYGTSSTVGRANAVLIFEVEVFDF